MSSVAATRCGPCADNALRLAIARPASLALVARRQPRPLQPIDLQVDGGEDSWHPQRTLRAALEQPAGRRSPRSTTACSIRPGRSLVDETTLDWAATRSSI